MTMVFEPSKLQHCNLLQGRTGGVQGTTYDVAIIVVLISNFTQPLVKHISLIWITQDYYVIK